jgi:hypothetical protein
MFQPTNQIFRERGREREREVNWKGVLSIFMENKWMKITCDCG